MPDHLELAARRDHPVLGLRARASPAEGARDLRHRGGELLLRGGGEGAKSEGRGEESSGAQFVLASGLGSRGRTPAARLAELRPVSRTATRG